MMRIVSAVRAAARRSGEAAALPAARATPPTPDATPAALNSTGVVGYPFYSPFGFNGRYLYARVGLTW